MDLAAFAAIAGAVVALGAMAVAIVQADAARKQADAAEEQADAARAQASAAEDQAKAAQEQAEIARTQAAAAWEQVAEARRANDEMAADRAARQALEAVRWTGSIDGNLSRILVRNQGNKTAFNVCISRYGADEDWLHQLPPDVVEFDEVRAGDAARFPIRRQQSQWPRQVYVYWDGAPHPRAVVVEVETY